MANERCSTRRQFLNAGALSIGTAALATLLDQNIVSASRDAAMPDGPRAAAHFRPLAKSIIYLFIHGGPSEIDLFDYKPRLLEWQGQELPASVRGHQRLTGMTANQSSLPLVASAFRFAQHGQSGTWISELLPNLATVADELCVLRAMYTEAINH